MTSLGILRTSLIFLFTTLGICCGLNEKYLPQVRVFEHLVPADGAFRGWSLAAGSLSLEVGML